MKKINADAHEGPCGTYLMCINTMSGICIKWMLNVAYTTSNLNKNEYIWHP